MKRGYKWGLLTDYGMRILVSTFETKRDAQKEFKRSGYTKDCEAWVEKVPISAKGQLD